MFFFLYFLFFFFNDTATTEIYTLSLHDALPIFESELNFGQERKSVYGPYYLSTFLDITGNHQGAHLLPNGCPFVVYDNVNPLDAKDSCTSSPVYIKNGEIKDITINLTDEFLTDNYTP